MKNLTDYCIFIVSTQEDAMKATIQKWGNSMALRLPKAITKSAEITNGSEVEISVSRGKVIILPLKREKVSLHRMLKTITKKNTHGEIDTGKPIGREIW